MKSIPNKWLGLWVDSSGKTIEISRTILKGILVSIKDGAGNFYSIPVADKPSHNLKAIFNIDSQNNPYLQIEAGIEDLGPTYHLYFLKEEKDGSFKLANESDAIEDIIVKPNIGLGLYDDYEDDLGVVWALPFLDYKKVL